MLGTPAESLIQKKTEEIREKKRIERFTKFRKTFKRQKWRDRKPEWKVKNGGGQEGQDNKAEIKRKQQLVKNMQEDLKIKKKEVNELEKKYEKTAKYSRKDRPTWSKHFQWRDQKKRLGRKT